MQKISNSSLIFSSDRAHEIGKAAEHLVCADLLLSGHGASIASAGMAYDIVADIAARLLRIQVKASCKSKNVNTQGRTPRNAYAFNARRRGKFGTRQLANTDCDLLALVALDIRVIGYLPVEHASQTIYLSPPGISFVSESIATKTY